MLQLHGSPSLAHSRPEQTEPAPTPPWLPIWEDRLCPKSAFDGAGPDPQGSFSLSPAKFPGCSSAVRLPSPERLLAPSATGNGPDNCSSRAGDFSICVCMDPTHASSLKPHLVFSPDLLSTYYMPSSVVNTRWGEGTMWRAWEGMKEASWEGMEEASDTCSVWGLML